MGNRSPFLFRYTIPNYAIIIAKEFVMTDEPEEKKPIAPLDPKTMTRDQINWKRQSLTEHLEVLLESMANAVKELIDMKEGFELNPAKRRELEKAMEVMDAEIEKAKKDLTDLNRA